MQKTHNPHQILTCFFEPTSPFFPLPFFSKALVASAKGRSSSFYRNLFKLAVIKEFLRRSLPSLVPQRGV